MKLIDTNILTTKTVAEVFNLSKTLPFTAIPHVGEDQIVNGYKESIPEMVKSTDTLIAVEIEVENCSGSMLEKAVSLGWKQVEESSLRNSGVELLHLPNTPENWRKKLIALYGSAFKSPHKPDFSWRTSAHVHFNARHLYLMEVLKVGIIFTLCEDAVNTYLPEDRRDSTFCVPIHQSYMPNYISQVISGQLVFSSMLKLWKKYAALNLRTVGLCDHHGDTNIKGSIEFRSFPGTENLSQLINWINLLIRINNAAKNIQLPDLEMLIMSIKNKEQYKGVMKQIFQDQYVLLDFSMIDELQSIIAAKDCFLPSFNLPNLLENIATEAGIRRAVKLKQRKIRNSRQKLGLKEIINTNGMVIKTPQQPAVAKASVASWEIANSMIWGSSHLFNNTTNKISNS